jgi:hypothetical protein
MVDTAHPFSLTREQAARLRTYIQAYRQYAFRMLLPTVARNAKLRFVQTVYAKLLEATSQTGTNVCMWLTSEEGIALKGAIAELHTWYTQQEPTSERGVTLADLTGLLHRLQEYG